MHSVRARVSMNWWPSKTSKKDSTSSVALPWSSTPSAPAPSLSSAAFKAKLWAAGWDWPLPWTFAMPPLSPRSSFRNWLSASGPLWWGLPSSAKSAPRPWACSPLTPSPGKTPTGLHNKGCTPRCLTTHRTWTTPSTPSPRTSPQATLKPCLN